MKRKHEIICIVTYFMIKVCLIEAKTFKVRESPPHYVTLNIRVSRRSAWVLCAGAAVRPAAVLTAAQCFAPRRWQMYSYSDMFFFGGGAAELYLDAGYVYQRLPPGDEGQEFSHQRGQVRSVRRVVYPAHYRFPRYDLAVAHLWRPWQFGDNLKMIRIPKVDEDYQYCNLTFFGEVRQTDLLSGLGASLFSTEREENTPLPRERSVDLDSANIYSEEERTSSSLSQGALESAELWTQVPRHTDAEGRGYSLLLLSEHTSGGATETPPPRPRLPPPPRPARGARLELSRRRQRERPRRARRPLRATNTSEASEDEEILDDDVIITSDYYAKTTRQNTTTTDDCPKMLFLRYRRYKIKNARRFICTVVGQEDKVEETGIGEYDIGAPLTCYRRELSGSSDGNTSEYSEGFLVGIASGKAMKRDFFQKVATYHKWLDAQLENGSGNNCISGILFGFSFFLYII